MLFVYRRFGKDNFPFLLKDMDTIIVVMEGVLTAENAAALSESVGGSLFSQHYANTEANRAALFVERDSGELFDLTDPNLQIKGISGFILSGLMQAHKDEKAYLVTTGYNRNMIRFSHSSQ